MVDELGERRLDVGTGLPAAARFSHEYSVVPNHRARERHHRFRISKDHIGIADQEKVRTTVTRKPAFDAFECTKATSHSSGMVEEVTVLDECDSVDLSVQLAEERLTAIA